MLLPHCAVQLRGVGAALRACCAWQHHYQDQRSPSQPLAAAASAAAWSPRPCRLQKLLTAILALSPPPHTHHHHPISHSAHIYAHTPAEDEALQALRIISAALGRAKLRRLDLSDNALGEKGIRACAAAFQEQVRRVYLAAC